MDEQVASEIASTVERLAAGAEALEKALGRLLTQQQDLEQKVERIVAAIDEMAATEGEDGANDGDSKRIAELERENQELKAQAQRTLRKTLPPLVSSLLAKQGCEDGTVLVDAGALDKTLGSLSVEQRIAVKAEMARAGMIG